MLQLLCILTAMLATTGCVVREDIRERPEHVHREVIVEPAPVIIEEARHPHHHHHDGVEVKIR